MKNRSTFWGLLIFCLAIAGVIGFFFYQSTGKETLGGDSVDSRPSGYRNDLTWCYDLLSRSDLEALVGTKLKHYYEYSSIGFTNTCNFYLTDGGPAESAEINSNAYSLSIELNTCPERQPECFDNNDVLSGKEGPQDGDVSLDVGRESRANPLSSEAHIILSRNSYVIIDIHNPKEPILSENTYPTRERIFRQIAKLLSSRLPEKVK